MRVIELRTVAALALLAAFSACATTPKPLLPRFSSADQDVYGGWIVISLVEKKAPRMAGELIAIEPQRLVVLTSTGAVRVEKREIKEASVTLYDPKTLLKNVTSGMLLSLLTNGFFAAVTIPLWGVAGGLALHNVSVAAEIDYPESGWDALSRASRFPQGLPEGFDIQKLEPRALPAVAKAEPRS
jgi:hypothetical protein